jgi:DNA-binding CsgD family transcriptional regulator
MALAADPDARVASVMSRLYAVTESLTHAEVGDAAAADAALADADLLGELSADQNSLRMLWWRARVHLALGRTAEADADLGLLAQWHAETRIDWDPSTPWRAARARVVAGDGSTDLARELAEEELVHAEHWGTPYAQGVALMARGLAEPGAGAVGFLEQAVEALATAHAGIELARAHVELGAALRRAGRRTDARHPLATGMDGALRCGSPALANRAWDELRLAGARPRRQHVTGVESLTAAERRVAAMAAEGRTNRDIAQALFVSVKTVEGHLRNAYAKLGIEGRAGLRDHLDESTG